MHGISWIPAREQDLVDLVAIWEATLSDAAKKTAFGWDATQCSNVLAVIGEFLNARNEYQVDKTKAKRLVKDEKKKALEAAMRKFANTSIRFNDKMTVADKLALGIGPGDETDTPQGQVTDTVDMTITNDAAADSHTHIIHYKKLGANNNAKAPWHLAVFQTYVQGPGDPEPLIDDDALWSRDIINMSSPFTHQYRSADAGKTAWYRAHWEAESSDKGQWSMSRAMIP
jgi:hypothetical protein